MNQHKVPIIFISGSSRSGTTMFNRVLGNHPNILSLNELHYIGNNWNIDGDDTWSKEKAEFQAANLLAVARRSIWDMQPMESEKKEATSLLIKQKIKDKYKPVDVFGQTLEYLLNIENKKVATDQTPRNILYADQILKCFPNARVIQLVRDPRAVLFSQKNRWRQRGLGAKGTPLWNAIRVYVNYHAYTVTKLWIAAYKKGESVSGHKNFMQLRFEDLVHDPEESLKEVCNFLGIEFYPNMVNVPRVGSSNLEHREDVRGISSDVVNAWKGKLSNAELWLCEKMARSSMKNLGYEVSNITTPWVGLVGQLLMYPLHVIGVVLMNPRLAYRIAKVIGR